MTFVRPDNHRDIEILLAKGMLNNIRINSRVNFPTMRGALSSKHTEESISAFGKRKVYLVYGKESCRKLPKNHQDMKLQISCHGVKYQVILCTGNNGGTRFLIKCLGLNKQTTWVAFKNLHVLLEHMCFPAKFTEGTAYQSVWLNGLNVTLDEYLTRLSNLRPALDLVYIPRRTLLTLTSHIFTNPNNPNEFVETLTCSGNCYPLIVIVLDHNGLLHIDLQPYLHWTHANGRQLRDYVTN